MIITKTSHCLAGVAAIGQVPVQQCYPKTLPTVDIYTGLITRLNLRTLEESNKFCAKGQLKSPASKRFKWFGFPTASSGENQNNITK